MIMQSSNVPTACVALSNGLRGCTINTKGRHLPAFFVDRSVRVKLNYFLGAMASFAALATRNFTTVFALI